MTLVEAYLCLAVAGAVFGFLLISALSMCRFSSRVWRDKDGERSKRGPSGGR